jgi:outer membrane receptor for ferrienterochelin and colicin
MGSTLLRSNSQATRYVRKSHKTKIALLFIAIVFSAIVVPLAGAGAATLPAPPIVRGDVRDRANGAPIAGARVTISGPGAAPISSATTNSTGTFELRGTFDEGSHLVVSATRFRTLSIELKTPTESLRLFLTRSEELHEIGNSHVASASGTSSTRAVPADAIQRDGSIRISDTLAHEAGVDFSGDALAPGGDAYLSLRGFSPSESATLLDGHPIGPIGVRASSPDTDGTIAGFNFQDAPYFALQRVDVTFGGSSSTLLSTNAIAGSVDLRTLDPTPQLDVVAQQGVGTQGHDFSAIRASGTTGTVGYVVAGGIVGTSGWFDGSPIAQTGLRGTDFTSATLGSLTYPVSGDYVLRNGLAKVVVTPTPKLAIALTAYDATSWTDKTGEGDNDFNPYAYTLANAPIGTVATCPRGVSVTTNAGAQCVSPSVYAAGASGPAGGGPGAWQAIRNQDYDVHASASIGAHALSADAYTDAYDVLYHRDASFASGPLYAFLDRWSTYGARVSDSFSLGANAISLGGTWLAQTLAGDSTNFQGTSLEGNDPIRRVEQSVFAEDAVHVTRSATLLVGASATGSSLASSVQIDPHIGVVDRVGRNDTVRFDLGRSSEDPAVTPDRVDLVPAGALNPNCGDIARATPASPANVDVGTGPSNTLSPETGTTAEIGYVHRFDRETQVGVTLYDSNVENRIVTGAFAAGAQLPSSAISPLLSRIADFCGSAPVPGAVTFTLNRQFNAASARLQGIELGGRTHVARHVTLAYAYDVQSVVLDDLPLAVLKTDPTLVDGLQAFEVPLHKANLEIDVSGAKWSGSLDAHFVGVNNPQQLPGYIYEDATLTQAFSPRASLTLTVSNAFDSHAQTYGLVGYGVPYATNAFNASLSSPFLQPFNERYGLQPRSVGVSATLHV